MQFSWLCETKNENRKTKSRALLISPGLFGSTGILNFVSEFTFSESPLEFPRYRHLV
jgi:hypothetical protein